MSRFGGFSIDISGALDAARKLSDEPARIQRAQKLALRTMIRRVPVEARRDIQTEYALKASRINAGLRMRATADGLVMIGSSRGIGLLNFAARQTRGGVSATVKRGQRKTYPGAFIRPGLNNNPLVFQRTGVKRRMKAGRYAGRVREAIEALYGPSIAQMLKHGERPDRIVTFAQRVLAAELDRLLAST